MFFLFAGWDAYQIRGIFESFRGSFESLEIARKVADENEASWAEIFTLDENGHLIRASQRFRAGWQNF